MRITREKGAKGVQVEVKIDKSAAEPKVTILTDRMTDEVRSIVQMLYESEPRLMAGLREENLRGKRKSVRGAAVRGIYAPAPPV